MLCTVCVHIPACVCNAAQHTRPRRPHNTFTFHTRIETKPNQTLLPGNSHSVNMNCLSKGSLKTNLPSVFMQHLTVIERRARVQKNKHTSAYTPRGTQILFAIMVAKA